MSLCTIDCDTPFGRSRIDADDDAIVAIYLPEQRASSAAREARSHPLLERARTELAEYFEGRRTRFDLPLAPAGTAFQRRVWEALRAIPFGETISYGQLAARVGAPRAARAVGAANAKNPISIVIPCHRVIGADGALRGYAGGAGCKAWLLAHEGARSGGADRPRAGGLTPP